MAPLEQVEVEMPSLGPPPTIEITGVAPPGMGLGLPATKSGSLDPFEPAMLSCSPRVCVRTK